MIMAEKNTIVKFLQSKPPAKRILQGQCDGNAEKKSKGEYKRDNNRSVKAAWFNEFTWLQVQDNHMFCKVYVEAKKRNVFVTGKDISKPKKMT